MQSSTDLQDAFMELQELHRKSIEEHRRQLEQQAQRNKQMRAEHEQTMSELHESASKAQERLRERLGEETALRQDAEEALIALKKKVREDAAALVQGEREAWRTVSEEHRERVESLEKRCAQAEAQSQKWKARYEHAEARAETAEGKSKALMRWVCVCEVHVLREHYFARAHALLFLVRAISPQYFRHLFSDADDLQEAVKGFKLVFALLIRSTIYIRHSPSSFD